VLRILCVYVYICIYVCVCVCVCKYTHIQPQKWNALVPSWVVAPQNTYVCVCVRACVRVCVVCVCVGGGQVGDGRWIERDPEEWSWSLSHTCRSSCKFFLNEITVITPWHTLITFLGFIHENRNGDFPNTTRVWYHDIRHIHAAMSVCLLTVCRVPSHTACIVSGVCKNTLITDVELILHTGKA